MLKFSPVFVLIQKVVPFINDIEDTLIEIEIVEEIIDVNIDINIVISISDLKILRMMMMVMMFILNRLD